MIRIVTDSGSDTPLSVIRAHNIGVVPGRIVFSGEVLLGHPHLTPAEFYRRLATADELPTQRDSTLSDFRDLYKSILDEDPRATILSVHVSEALATTSTPPGRPPPPCPPPTSASSTRGG